MAKNRVKIIISSVTKGAETGFKKVKSGLSGIGKLAGQLFSPTGLIAAGLTGFGVTKLAGSFIDAAKQTENYKIRLESLLGSQAEGNRLFKEMADYAARVPFEYEQIMASATQLSGILKGGVDEITQWMPLIGDLAAAAGLDIQTATEQVSRMLSAGAASADLFRERGVLAMLGFNAGVSYSVEDTRKMLMAAWEAPESRFRGATKKMENSWDGMVSMLKDAWFSFRTAVMDSGPFKAMKTYVQSLIDQVNEFKKSGKFDDVAEKLGGGITKYLNKFVNALPAIFSFMLNVVEKLIMAVGGWREIIAGLKWVIAEARLWGFNFVQSLRENILSLAQALDALPGVDTSETQANVARKMSEASSNYSWKLGAEADEAEKQFLQTISSVEKLNSQVDKTFDDLSAGFTNTVTTMTTRVDEMVQAQKKMGPAAKEGIDQAVNEVERYIVALQRAKAAQQQLTDFRGSNLGGNLSSLEARLKDAERTE